MKLPIYDFDEFVRCCNEHQSDVVPLNGVIEDADRFFSLKTKTELLNFIGNNGLEDLKFDSSAEWHKNPNKDNVILIDAYEFRSMGKLGYIAFMRSDITLKWLIKSFHLSKNGNLALALALTKAGFIERK